jgi:DNA-binding GntR family transcriptional regulator
VVDASSSQHLGNSHRELWHVVRDELRALIINGEIPPGERLVETVLAERFAVSRGPVRTALMELERVGLVTSVPRRGMYVSTFSRADIDELFGVNRALERLAARQAALVITDEQVDGLATLLDELAKTQKYGEPGELIEAELELHRALVRASDNKRLVRLWEQITEEIRFLIAVTQRALPDVFWASYELPIVEGLRARDPDAAERAVEECFKVAHEKIQALSEDAFDRSTGRKRGR